MGRLRHDDQGPARKQAVGALCVGGGDLVRLAVEMHVHEAVQILPRFPGEMAGEGQMHHEHAGSITKPERPLAHVIRHRIRRQQPPEQQPRRDIGDHGARSRQDVAPAGSHPNRAPVFDQHFGDLGRGADDSAAVLDQPPQSRRDRVSPALRDDEAVQVRRYRSEERKRGAAFDVRPKIKMEGPRKQSTLGFLSAEKPVDELPRRPEYHMTELEHTPAQTHEHAQRLCCRLS